MDTHADPPPFFTIYCCGYKPSFPFFFPAELLSTLLYRFCIVYRPVGIPVAISPEIAIPGFHIILLKELDRIKASLFHGKTEERDEGALQFLSPKTSHDA